MPDAGAVGQELGGDPGAQSVQGAGAMGLEAELSLRVQKIDSMRWRMPYGDYSIVRIGLGN